MTSFAVVKRLPLSRKWFSTAKLVNDGFEVTRYDGTLGHDGP